jgi:hypothetical protein
MLSAPRRRPRSRGGRGRQLSILVERPRHSASPPRRRLALVPARQTYLAAACASRPPKLWLPHRAPGARRRQPTAKCARPSGRRLRPHRTYAGTAGGLLCDLQRYRRGGWSPHLFIVAASRPRPAFRFRCCAVFKPPAPPLRPSLRARPGPPGTGAASAHTVRALGPRRQPRGRQRPKGRSGAQPSLRAPRRRPGSRPGPPNHLAAACPVRAASSGRRPPRLSSASAARRRPRSHPGPPNHLVVAAPRAPPPPSLAPGPPNHLTGCAPRPPESRCAIARRAGFQRLVGGAGTPGLRHAEWARLAQVTDCQLVSAHG